MRLFIVLLYILLAFRPFLEAQTRSDSTGINTKRLNTVIIGAGVAYGATLVALNNAWYKQQRSSFHFFNDNAQWNQVDKLGHFYSAYQLSSIGKQMFMWTNMPEKKSAIWGSVLSQIFMIPIDIFDGFSEEYGFSWGDIAANMLGSGLFLSQELIFGEQKIKVKYSFHFTEYPDLRPDVLGSGSLEEILKDYNGHTYWLSFDLHSIFNHNRKIPSWINIACGYGAEGMVYGSEPENGLFGYESYRQYYFGLDVDLSHIKTNSKLLNTVIFVLDMIKLPAPTLEFNKHETNFYWLYF